MAPEPIAGAAPFEGRGSKSTAKRRRGVVPNDLRQRLDGATEELGMRLVTRHLAAHLGGVHPSVLTEDELREIRETWEELADPALRLLDQVGYGAPPARLARAERAYGLRREARLKGVLGKMPRSIALRLPTSADTHRTGRNDITDVWGSVKCSRTLRADHVGVIAAAGGLWHAHARDGERCERYVDVTAPELVQLLLGHRRGGGKDNAWIHGLLADLEALDLRADVRPGKTRSGKKGEESEAHRIPSSPIALVERRVGDRWVRADEYGAAVAAAAQGDGADLLEVHAAEHGECPGIATIRIHLADWFRAELAHPTRRPVYVNFDLWAHYRPSTRRLYAFVQALGRGDYDDRLEFYLGKPLLATLGLSGQRLDRSRAIVSHDLAAMWRADHRYRSGRGFRPTTQPNTDLPGFAYDVPRGVASAPTTVAMTTKSPPKRPSGLRGAVARLRRHSILSVTPDQLDAGHMRRVGMQAAKRERELVRQAIQTSLSEAAAASGPVEPSKVAGWRRQQGNADDDDIPR